MFLSPPSLTSFCLGQKMGDYKDIENQLKDFWEKEPTKVDGEIVFTIGECTRIFFSV